MATPDGTGSELEGTSWSLASIGADRALDGSTATLTFEAADALRGSDGCNRFTGTYTHDGDALELRLGPSTLMACPEQVMSQAQAFIGAIGGTARFAVVGPVLTLLDDGGTALATLTLRSPRSLEDSAWSATAVNNGKGGVGSLVAGSEITAGFGPDGEVTGTAGTNRYRAAFTVDGGELSIGPAVTTRMAGDPAVMEQERHFLQALRRVATFAIDDDGGLELRDTEGALQVSFDAQPAQPAAGEAPAPRRPGDTAVLDGTVRYRARRALPDDAVIELAVEDVSRADAPAVEIARQSMTAGGRQVPIPFSLGYDPAAIDERMTYALRVRITIDDQLAWMNTKHTPVITHGAPSAGVDVLVEQVRPPRP